MQGLAKQPMRNGGVESIETVNLGFVFGVKDRVDGLQNSRRWCLFGRVHSLRIGDIEGATEGSLVMIFVDHIC